MKREHNLFFRNKSQINKDKNYKVQRHTKLHRGAILQWAAKGAERRGRWSDTRLYSV
jgi:hypothetical protein